MPIVGSRPAYRPRDRGISSQHTTARAVVVADAKRPQAVHKVVVTGEPCHRPFNIYHAGQQSDVLVPATYARPLASSHGRCSFYVASCSPVGEK